MRTLLDPICAAFAGLALTALGSPVFATTFFPQEFTCPVGGEKFEAEVVASNTTFGARPDGRPYSPLPIYPITECPGNGLLIHKDKFSEEEVARLTPLVASVEYQAMRKIETPYYRLWWLKKAMGSPDQDLVWALMVAGWEADEDPARKARYQRAFADALSTAAPPAEPDGRFWLGVRHANVLRELGDFDAAAAVLAQIEPQLDALLDDEERPAARDWVGKLKTTIAARISLSEPVTLIPAEMAVRRCVTERDSLAPVERQACEGRAIQKEIASYTSYDDKDRILKGEEAIRYDDRKRSGGDE